MSRHKNQLPSLDAAVLKTVETIGWATAMAISHRFDGRGSVERFEQHWLDVESGDVAKGARHFAEMAYRGFDDEIDRILKDEPTPAEMKLCLQLGAAMARVDFDDYDFRLRDFICKMAGTPNDDLLGTLWAARACGRTYQNAAIDSIQVRAASVPVAGEALRVALLAGPAHPDEVTRILGIDTGAFEDLIDKDEAVAMDGPYVRIDSDVRRSVIARLVTADTSA